MKHSNYTNLLDALDPNHRDAIYKVHKTLVKNGYQGYLVGGLVRDLILGNPTEDTDIATDATPRQILGLFKRVIPTGIKHGTVTVLLDNYSFEITTFRSEGVYSDARHPDEVQFAKTLEEDLKRRDFTINALSYDPSNKSLIDLHGGLDDLNNKIIKTIGLAEERFMEDALRPVRACRFCAKLDFNLEKKTEEALHSVKIHEKCKKVAVERFSDELLKGFKSRFVSKMVEPLYESGILILFITHYIHSKIKTKSLDLLYGSPPEFKLAKWWLDSGILHDQVKVTGNALKFSNKRIRDIEWYQKSIMFFDELSSENKVDNEYFVKKFLSSIKEIYKENGVDFLGKVPVSCCPQSVTERLIDIYERAPLLLTDLKINGNDLMQAGINGKNVGRALNFLRQIILQNPELNKREILLEYANKIEF